MSFFTSRALMLCFLASFTIAPAFAKSDACSLFVSDPVINHTTFGRNSGPNKVNSGVIRKLQDAGFTITTNENKAQYTMNTEVRCGQTLTIFGFSNACQTEVTFINNKEEKVAYTDGPTAPSVGLNIDFNSINFPLCKDL